MALTEKEIKNLKRAMAQSDKGLRVFREKRTSALRQFVGKHYSDSGSSAEVPLNLIEQAVGIYTKSLIPNTPRVMVSTVHNQLKAVATNLELAVNHLIEEIDLQDTLERLVTDAMFSLGVAKIGINYCSYESEGARFNPGQPFVAYVNLDDFIIDLSVDRPDMVSFIGNRYKVPLEYAKSCELFDEEVRKNLKTDKAYMNQSDWFSTDEDPASNIQRSDGNIENDFQEMVTLVDVYLPFKKRYVTLVENDTESPVLLDKEWDGPESGPYRLLAFQPVPSNIMPLPPVANWFRLHEISNALFNKLSKQAERQKTFTVVTGSSGDDGARIKQVKDGEIIRVDDPKGVNEIRQGGVDANNNAFTQQCRDYFSYFAGNLDSLGGLSAMSDTFKQDELIHKAANSRLMNMQDKTINFIKNVCKDLTWYLWYDPLIDLPLVKRTSTGSEFATRFTPEDREGDYLDYNISVDPYSLQPQTPSSKLAAIYNTLERAVYPYMQLYAQQGISLDMAALLRAIIKFSNIPEINDIIVYSDPGQADISSDPVGTPPRKISVLPSSGTGGAQGPASLRGKETAISQFMMKGADSVQPAMFNTMGQT